MKKTEARGLRIFALLVWALWTVLLYNSLAFGLVRFNMVGQWSV